MGKFINPKEKSIVNSYIDSYLQGTDLYSKYVESSPTFVTYYSKDALMSTQDVGLGEVVEIVGNESPIKYNKIHNFPLFSLDEIIPSLYFDEEVGFETNKESSALIIPGTIIPMPDDLIIFDNYDYTEDNIKTVYRITNVEMSSLSTKTFYKVSFSGYDIFPEFLEEKQIKDEYGLVYENIGTDKNALIIQKDLLLVDKISELKENLCKKYIDYFYMYKINSFCFYKDDYYCYDACLAHFISNSRIFIEKRNFLKNLVIEDLLNTSRYYDRTIYGLLEYRNQSNIDKEYFNGYLLSDLNCSIFSLYQDKFKELLPTTFVKKSKCKNCSNCNKCKNKSNNEFSYFTSNDFKRIILEYENINSVKDLNIFDKLYILYIKDFNNIKNEEFVSLIEDIKVSYDIQNYIFIPIVIFILDRLYDRIFKQNPNCNIDMQEEKLINERI